MDLTPLHYDYVERRSSVKESKSYQKQVEHVFETVKHCSEMVMENSFVSESGEEHGIEHFWMQGFCCS